MRRARCGVSLVAVVLLMACCIHGFAPSSVGQTRNTCVENLSLIPLDSFSASSQRRRHDTIILSAAATGGEADQESSTLYDVLGASPTDSYQVLRRKYTSLARQMHPDSSTANTNTTTDATEFTQLVEAWRVLADPKERLKYDRSLKAKEFTDNMELFIEQGIRTAIPFMKKTANTTFSAVETSSKTFGQVSQRMGVAMDILDLDRQSQTLEQQATRETLQAKRLKEELANLDSKKHAKLNNGVNSKLSSVEALRILDSFTVADVDKVTSQKEISVLQSTEVQYKDQHTLVKVEQRQVRAAERNVESAKTREKLAQERLEAAQRELAAAKVNMETSLKQQKEATAKKKTAVSELDKVSGVLEKNAEKVHLSLQKRQGESLQRLSTNLRKESARCEEEAKKLRREAQTIKLKSEKIKRQQEKENQKQK